MTTAPRKNTALFIVLVIIGIGGIADLIARPHLRTLRAVDAVQMAGSILCLVLALILLGAGRRDNRRTGS